MTPPTRPKPGLYPADAAIEPAPPPRLPEPVEPTGLKPPAPPRRGRAARWFWRAALALVAGLIVLDAALFLDGLFDRSLALGAMFALLIGATAAAGLWWAGSEIRQIRLLDAVDEVREAAAAALASEGYGKAPPFLGRARRLMAGRPVVRRRFDRLEDMILDTHSDRDIMELFRREVLLPLDAEAYAAVRRAAQWTAVGVSASPVALLDAVLAIWRSLRMVREIAEVYGFRPGPVSTVALARHVLTGAASITAVDVVGDLWAQHLGHRVAGLLSAKLAEGVYAAVRVARLGLLAMQTCRPAPFAPEDEPSLGRLRKEIVGSLTRSLGQPREEGAES